MTLIWWDVSTFKAPCPIFPASITLTPMFSNSPAILDFVGLYQVPMPEISYTPAAAGICRTRWTQAAPVPEHLRAGVDSGLRRQSGAISHLQRAGQRRDPLCERLSRPCWRCTTSDREIELIIKNTVASRENQMWSCDSH